MSSGTSSVADDAGLHQVQSGEIRQSTPVRPHTPTGRSGQATGRSHSALSQEPAIEEEQGARPTHEAIANEVQVCSRSRTWADGRKRVSYDEESNETIEIKARGQHMPTKPRRGSGARTPKVTDRESTGPRDIPIAGMTEEDRLWAEGAEGRQGRQEDSELESEDPLSPLPETVTDDGLFGDDSDFDPADVEAINRAMGPDEELSLIHI